MFGFGIAVIEIWHTELPVWAFILALIIGASLNTRADFILDVPPPFSIRVHDPDWCYSGYDKPTNHY